MARKSGVDGAVHMLIANIYFRFILEVVTKNPGEWQKIPKIDKNALYTTMYKGEYGTYQNGTPSTLETTMNISNVPMKVCVHIP